MRIKLDPADIIFSKYIRTRDGWICQRCKKKFEPNSQGLHCSHYFGRGRESTRFDPDNCDSLDFGCHRIWESQDREAYREFKIKQLGEQKFKLLQIKANTHIKKDRKLALIIAKKLLQEELDKRGLDDVGVVKA